MMMRKSIIKVAPICVVCLSILMAQRDIPTPKEFLLEAGKAGPYEVGMPVVDVYQLAGEKNVDLVATFPEGTFEPKLNLLLAGFDDGVALAMPVSEWPCGPYAVRAIDVRDPRFRTANGLGVGSTFGDLKRLYGSNLEVDRAEGGSAVIIDQLKMAFELVSSDKYVDTTKVESVWIPGDPREVAARRCPDWFDRYGIQRPK